MRYLFHVFFCWFFSCFFRKTREKSRKEITLERIYISEDSPPISKRKKEALYCKNLVCTLIFLSFLFKRKETKINNYERDLLSRVFSLVLIFQYTFLEEFYFFECPFSRYICLYHLLFGGQLRVRERQAIAFFFIQEEKGDCEFLFSFYWF